MRRPAEVAAYHGLMLLTEVARDVLAELDRIAKDGIIDGETCAMRGNELDTYQQATARSRTALRTALQLSDPCVEIAGTT